MMAGGFMGTYEGAVHTGRNRAAGRTLRQWQDTFHAIGSQGPTRKAMSAIGAHLVSSTIERMDKGVTPSGQAFKPLSAAYVASKGNSIFWQSGSKQHGGESRKKVQATRVTRKSVIMVINTPYSGWADSDGRVPRPVLGVSREDMKAIDNILTRDLREQLARGH